MYALINFGLRIHVYGSLESESYRLSISSLMMSLGAILSVSAFASESEKTELMSSKFVNALDGPDY